MRELIKKLNDDCTASITIKEEVLEEVQKEVKKTTKENQDKDKFVKIVSTSIVVHLENILELIEFEKLDIANKKYSDGFVVRLLEFATCGSIIGLNTLKQFCQSEMEKTNGKLKTMSISRK